MLSKKAFGKIYGAHLSAKQKKAMDMEINREIVEYTDRHVSELIALIFWTLHERYGFGEKRLRTLFDLYHQAADELKEKYERGEDDEPWLCTRKLKEIGIDILAWEKERNE